MLKFIDLRKWATFGYEGKSPSNIPYELLDNYEVHCLGITTVAKSVKAANDGTKFIKKKYYCMNWET